MLRGIRPGELDHVITIKSRSTANDPETNEEVITWQVLKTKQVKRLGPRSNEDFEAKQQVALKTVRYFGRYDSAIDETMMITDGTETFYITGIEFMDRKTSMMITVEKRDNG